jgi:hypothetical protein
MIIGSDAIFHFNRFFETAEQIKHWNFEYFISLYGFQQSGRIVNAFYSPYLAYLHGLLVLISKNWFIYQMLSNFILFLISGLSMSQFLKAGHVTQLKSCYGAIFYMSTFSVLYWVTRQGFSSWGAAIMPLCLSIIFPVLQGGKFPKFKLGILTALMFQVHMLSALILVMIYLPVFAYGLFRSSQKLSFLRQILREILLFILLTLNIWAAFFTAFQQNNLIAPFVNKEMSSNTINQNSYYWLINPISLLIVLFLVVAYFLTKWTIMDNMNRFLFSILTFFLILSTSVIPWNHLIDKQVPLVGLVQFPFRFFVPVTILAIYLFFKLSNVKKANLLFVSAGIIQVILLMFTSLGAWRKTENFLTSGTSTILATENAKDIKSSFFVKDKAKALELVQKPTPDYLPSYTGRNKNPYQLYANEIIHPNDNFNKTVKKNRIIVKEKLQEKNSRTIEFPVTIYTNSKLTTKGKPISKKKYKLSKIGSPIIARTEIRNNQIELEFDNSKQNYLAAAVMLFWPIAFILQRKTA